MMIFIMKYSYEYFVYIRPYSVFFNQLPFNLIFTHGNSNEKSIKTLNKSYLYNCLEDNNEQIRITFYYNGEKYRSSYFDITSTESIELMNYDDQKKGNLTCCILKSLKIVDLRNNFNYDVQLIEFSCLSYEYIIFFKYLIINKVPKSIWVRPYFKDKKIEIKGTELKSGQITIVNSNNKSNKNICFKEEGSKWSIPYNFKLIKAKGAFEIDTEIEKEDKIIIKTKDISCILSWGKNYDNSKILILQQQFIIHNKLEFDIYYIL